METKTKYEIWQEKDAEIKKREKNIERLSHLQARVSSLRAVIPMPSDDYNQDEIIRQERVFIQQLDHEVQQMRQSELDALEVVLNGLVYPEEQDDTFGKAEL